MTSDGSGLQPRPAGRGTPEYLQTHPRSDSLADVLERVLDKGGCASLIWPHLEG